jgi:hypothetical protein
LPAEAPSPGASVGSPPEHDAALAISAKDPKKTAPKERPARLPEVIISWGIIWFSRRPVLIGLVFPIEQGAFVLHKEF